MPDVAAAADYLVAVIGNTQGFVHVGVGIHPYRTDSGSYRFRRWCDCPFSWPDDADDVLMLLREYSGELDCYLAPNVMTGPQRAKWTSVAPMEVHADIDGGRLDLDKVRSIPSACAVGSGSPNNGHVYLLLTRPVSHHHHEQLCRGLSAYLGAIDSKISDNDMLRVPGTFNFKPTLAAHPPTPVNWLLPPPTARVDPEELAAAIGVELTEEPPSTTKPVTKQSTGGGVVLADEAEPFNLDLHPQVTRALAKATGDRSADTMRVIGVCSRSGLTEANARWAVLQRDDLAERLLCRHDDDVARCFGRAFSEDHR
ncbi:DNA-primase RepB domain-containing protein [Mycobacterium sp. E2733]|uniref:DNA-primase RepB domain-containing protein n=1 Tax=Mycobacterium sp. E2733 TaxID=1834138 RepID=UPI0018D35A03|nr:DNA-primase RepB domain-containing protein [Mycobacterium sp. E2733]